MGEKRETVERKKVEESGGKGRVVEEREEKGGREQGEGKGGGRGEEGGRGRGEGW